MYRILSFFTAAIIFLALFSSCKNDPQKFYPADSGVQKPDTIKMAAPLSKEGATTFIVTEGVVYWQASKAMGGEHNGTIRIASGEVLVKEGQLLSGNITIDMPSLTVSDLKDPGEKGELESHLKSADFFAATKFPTAQFKFEEVLPSNSPAFNAVLPGMLTIKDKSQSVNVPVKMTIAGDELTATSTTFIINRTKWGINFNSGILGTAKDKLIDDNVPLAITIKAKAKR